MNQEIEKLLKDILEIDRLDHGQMQKLRNGKYLILLDMGCGSTSAAFLDLKRYMDSKEVSPENYIYPITWDYNQFSINSIRPLRVRGNVSIPTVVGYNDLKCVIGPEALVTGNACENFKACPTNQNLNEVVLQIWNFDGSCTPKRLRDIWPNYFYGVLEKICGWCSKQGIGPRNMEELTNGETIVMAAHPAGEEWSEPSVLQNYRELIENGTGMPAENVLTISEAKAAMQYIRRKPLKENPNQIRKLDFDRGVVIIDIGASTIDVEYLTKKSAYPLEYSFELAGRNVDALLAHYILENIFPEAMKNSAWDSIPDDAFFEELPFPKSQLMFDVRVLKEGICTAEQDPQARGKEWVFQIGIADRTFEVPLNSQILRGLLGDLHQDPYRGMVSGRRDITIVYDLPVLQSVYRKNPQKKEQQPENRRAIQRVDDTWYGHLEDMIGFVMDDLKAAGHSAAQVIVTGGSCHLLGIKEHIWQAIRSSKIGIYQESDVLYMDMEQDYENSVPFGGGYYVSGVLSRMDELVNFPATLYQTLYQELKGKAVCRILGKVHRLVQKLTLETLEWWKSLPEGDRKCSIKELNRKLDQNTSFVLKNTNRLNAAIEDAIASICLEKDLPQTMAEIKALLNALAQTRFTGKMDTKVIRISLPAENVIRMVSSFKPENLHLGFGQALAGWMQDLGYAIIGTDREDIIRTSGYRSGAYESYKSRLALTDDPAAEDKRYCYTAPGSELDSLRRKISGELEKEFQRTGICGIPDQIIRDLRNDIMCALYLSE